MIFRIFIVAAFLGGCWLTPQLSAQPAIDLDLREALQRAGDANFAILIGQESVEARRQQARRSRAGLLPTVDGSVAQSRAMAPNVGNFAADLPNVPERSFNNRFDALLRARLSALDINRIADYRVALFDVEIAEYDLAATIQDILQGIALTYFNHLRNIARLEVLEANIERDRTLLEIAENQLEAGVATPIDVTRAEVQLAQNEIAKLQQETRVVDSALRIKRILNLPLGTDLRISETLYLYADRRFAALLEHARLETVLRDRPEYRRERLTLERNEYARRAAGWERLPSLEIGADWGYASSSITGSMREQWRVQAALSFPLFDGFRIQANRLQAMSAVRQQSLIVEDFEKEVDADLRFASHNLNSRARQIEIARKQVELSERELDLALTRFREGVADNRDVVTAQANLAQANDTLVEAIFQYSLARLEFARTTGDVTRLLDE